MKSGKQHQIDGIELPNEDKIRTLAENESYKYLRILEADTIKQVERKNKIQKEYLRRTRKLLETKLNSRNLIKGINTCAIQRLEDYIEKHESGLITAIRNNTDNTIDNRMTTSRKQKWEGKQLYERFKRLINNIFTTKPGHG